ncbi:site-specific integrase [Mucilaginibacter sp. AW1-3]
MKPAKNESRDWRWIYARLTVCGERLDFSTQRKCKLSEWEGQRVKGNREEARSINHWLDTLQLRAHAARQELYGKVFGPRHVRKLMQGEPLEPARMVSEAWQYHMDYISGLIGKDYSGATLQKYKAGQKAFKKFLKLKFQKDDIALNELDHAFIKDYEFYLKTGHGVQNNTAIQIIKKLRTVVKIAMDFGWLQRDPFIAHRMKSTEVHRTFLSSDELQRLATKKLDNKLGMVRDLFLFSCYTGLAFTDTIKLEANDLVTGEDGEPWLQTHRSKNNNRVRVPLLAPAQKLLDTYKDHPRTPEGRLMPRISNQKANAYLKQIAEKAHINKHLTYHCARHTFATTVTLTNGVPIETVGQMLGHKKLATTQLYARVTDTKVMKDMVQVKAKYEQ